MKVFRGLAVALILAGMADHTRASAQSTDAAVLSCGDRTLAQPRHGVTYRGLVQNGDYRFAVRVPPGYVGWGAAPDAPFHGFAVFLAGNPPPAPQSCITFLIQHRVFLPEDDGARQAFGRTAEWNPLKVGSRSGFQKIALGSLNGVPFENITVKVELSREGYTNDLTIWFVTPQSERDRTEPVFRVFISTYKFW